MTMVWLVVALLLLPGIAAGQTPPQTEVDPRPSTQPPSVIPPQVPGLVIFGVSPSGTQPLVIAPQVPPPATVPSGPEVILGIPAPGTVRAGRFLEFRPSIGLTEEYTDNFNQTERNKVSNFRTILTPGLRVLLDDGPLTGSASYDFGVAHDSSASSFDPGFHHSLAALIQWEATPLLRLTASEALLHTDDPDRADRLLVSRGQRQTFTSSQTLLQSDYLLLNEMPTRQSYRFTHFSSDDATTQSHIFGLSGSRNLGAIHLLSAGYEYLYDDVTELRGSAQSTESTISGHQVTASFSRDLTPLTTAGLSAVYATREQEFSTGGRFDFSRWKVSLFTNHVRAERLTVRSELGIARLDPADLTVFSSLSNVSWGFGPATLSFTMERGFSETFEQGQNFGVVETNGYSAAIVYEFSPFLSARLIGSYRENEATGVGGGVAGSKDKNYVITAGVSYLITSWLSASVEASHTQREISASGAAVGTGSSFSENRIRASLNALFQ